MDNGKMRNGKWKEKNGKRNKKKKWKQRDENRKIEKKMETRILNMDSSTPYNTLHTTLTRTAGALSTDLNDSWRVLG